MGRASERFKVTILNWEKHNGTNKRGYSHFLVSKRIFNDEKIAQLSPNEFQFFMYCLAIAADMATNQFTISAETIPKYMRIGRTTLQNALVRLQSLQILTYENFEKKAPYNNIIYNNNTVIEEVYIPTEDKENPSPPSATPIFQNNFLEELREYFLGNPFYSRLKAPGNIKKIYEHYGGIETVKLAYLDLRENYEKKNPFKGGNEDAWQKDFHSFVENSMLKEIAN